MPAADTCTFSGTVRSLHIQGYGPVVLTEEAAFTGAEQTVVEGAFVGYQGPPSFKVQRPSYFVPVGMNHGSSRYDVTYSAGPEIIINITAGGTNGHVTGDLASHRECASEKCEVVWLGSTKTVRLVPAKEAARVALAGPFPLVPDSNAPEKPYVEEVIADGATGELRCDATGNTEKLKAAHRDFQMSSNHMLSVGALELEHGQFHVQIINDSPPPAIGPFAAAVSVACFAGLVGGVLVVWRRLRRRQMSAARRPYELRRSPGDGTRDTEPTEPLADVLIVTALREEYLAVLSVDTGAVNGNSWDRRLGSTRLEVAFRDFTTKQGTLRIAVTQALGMGGVSATTAAAQLIRDYRVRCLAMCGVCAGRRGEVELGDVIVADRLWQYDTGKLNTDSGSSDRQIEREQSDIDMYRIHPPEWKQVAERFRVEADARWLALRPRSYEAQGDWILERILRGRNPATDAAQGDMCRDYGRALALLWKKGLLDDGGLSLTSSGRDYIGRLLTLERDKLPEQPPLAIRVGPIASGNKVMQDAQIFALLAHKVRKVIGVEMEAAAIGALAEAGQLPYSVVMKAVMDYADSDKNDNFKEFAALASAECLIAFVREALPPRSP